ncbi:hypothetical protein [Clostridium weizhouense]|uniref:Uncharacterized protein n=1 Tax=Clostridium weizhouense TaxID=2859781 RepID=A0ABS7ALW8_9CLOT|nr:hypothetical protein [Clostridium weizhouense]MBW6409656.1 hypothetical protein [Clostridium weizhouense]
MNCYANESYRGHNYYRPRGNVYSDSRSNASESYSGSALYSGSASYSGSGSYSGSYSESESYSRPYSNSSQSYSK